MMITPMLVRPARCSRSARASARISCARSALLGRRGGPGGGGTRGPRIHRPLNGRHLGPPNRQFHDKFSGLYGSSGSSMGHLAGERLLSSEYEAVRHQRQRAGHRPAISLPLAGAADASLAGLVLAPASRPGHSVRAHVRTSAGRREAPLRRSVQCRVTARNRTGPSEYLAERLVRMPDQARNHSESSESRRTGTARSTATGSARSYIRSGHTSAGG